MKLGEPSDSIYANTYNLSQKLQGADYPLAESATLLTMEDGSFDWVKFGARVEYNGNLQIFDLLRADYFNLTTFIKANIGNKIRFTLSNDSENPWTDSTFLNASGYFYAVIKSYTDEGEEDFSVSKKLFSITLDISYTGKTSTDIPNTVDTSLLDVCHEIDTVRANVTVSNKTALDAVSNPVGGWVGYTTSDRKVYIYDKKSGTWKFQYTLTADYPAYGFVNGVFYLSAFADISSGSPASEGKYWKSGLINKDSIVFAPSGLDITKGPAIETLEGFSLAVQNDDMFWNFIIQNNIKLYNALVKQKFYDRTNGKMVLNRSGVNTTNSFDYHNYTFQVDPEILNGAKSYPEKTFNKTDNPNAATEVIGSPIISTFGRWLKGEIQAENFTLASQKFISGRRFLTSLGYNAGLKKVTVNIGSSEFLSLLNYASTSNYPGTTPTKYLYLQITAQDNQPDVNKMIRIDAIAANSGNTDLTLATSFAKNPDGTSVFQIFMSVIDLLIDDDKCVGLRAPDYLVASSQGATSIPMQLYAKINNAIEQVPDSYYSVLSSNENELTLNGDNISIDNFGKVTLKDTLEISHIDYSNNKRLLDSSDPTTYDFGYTPDGLLSIKQKIYVGAGTWNISTTYGVQSSDRITVGWIRQYYTTSGRLLTSGDKIVLLRYKYKTLKDGVSRSTVVDVTKITITDYTATFYVDTGMDPAYPYLYTVQYFDSSNQPISIVYQFENSRTGTNGGYRLDVNANTSVNLKIIPDFENAGIEATLIWNRIPGQRQVKVFRDSTLIATLDTTTGPYLNATAYQVPASSEGLKEWYIQVSNSNIGSNNDRWFIEDGKSIDDLWSLQQNSDPTNLAKYFTLRDSDLSNSQHGYRVNTVSNGVGIPAAGVVFQWMLRVDHTLFPDLSNAKDVRLLSDFVVRSYYDSHTQQPIFIQLRGVRADGTSAVLQQYTDNGNGLAGKEQTTGAFLQFVNLPTNKGGDDANYNTEQQSSNTDGKYTGKDMWRLPDWLFVDSAYEWNRIEYLMFTVTNATFIIPAAVDFNQKGYKIGMGGLANSTNSFTNVNKDKFYIEYEKEFESGLQTPQFGRIDGGVVDDASGTFTGTPYLIIERAKHMANYIMYKMLGYLPLYLGSEMNYSGNWVCRYQSKESIDTQAMLDMIVKNLWACLVVSPDGKWYLRPLDIEEPRISTVITFNTSRIIKDSITIMKFNKQTDTYQQFKFKLNYEPSVAVLQADPNEQKNKNRSYTEEIIVGWDTQAGAPIKGGYSRIILDANGNIKDDVDAGDENKLTDLCKTSCFLYTTGSKINQYGYDKDALLEWFYRPTTKDPKTNQSIEYDYPDAKFKTLHGPMIKSPKRTAQDRIGKEVRFRALNGWAFSFKVHIKYTIYDTNVSGIADESNTPDNRLKRMDRIIFNHPFYTNNQNLYCFIQKITPDFYNGVATLSLYAPKPPGQLGAYIDHFWDAAFGSRDVSNYAFKGTDYSLNNEPGTFADAGNGSRNVNNFKFPDGTFADSKGEGTGKV